ncbi:hypothetical protein K7X08_015234 [Anisodus acutangulus]|uniref:Uncharacterized protein n=1 Tax=Anisodus acutangulus TaxID=402998 RepID=A0A9Q1L3D5_9SOLA|nr:hypothetical protein K7X08_015234 [Anisodus acutangulus]
MATPHSILTKVSSEIGSVWGAKTEQQIPSGGNGTVPVQLDQSMSTQESDNADLPNVGEVLVQLDEDDVQAPKDEVHSRVLG